MSPVRARGRALLGVLRPTSVRRTMNEGMYRAVVAVSLSLSSACGPSETKGGSKPSPPAATATASARATSSSSAAKTPAATAFVSSPSTMAPWSQLSLGMTVTEASLGGMFPGYDVKRAERPFDEGAKTLTVFTLTKAGTPQAELWAEDGKAVTVRVQAPGFTIPTTNLTVGRALGSGDVEKCGCRGEDGRDGFRCETSNAEFWVVFEAAEKDCALSSDEAAKKALQDRTIMAASLR